MQTGQPSSTETYAIKQNEKALGRIWIDYTILNFQEGKSLSKLSPDQLSISSRILTHLRQFNLLNRKQDSNAHNLSLLLTHRPDMTEILLDRT